jgi:tetratricopeptide (TPR) repeat protein
MSDILEQAKALAKEGHHEASLALFKEAGGVWGAYGEAACLHKLGRDDEAREALKRCLELDPKNQKAATLITNLRAPERKSTDGLGIALDPHQREETLGERSRIYQEEKTRFEAREQIKQEQENAKREATKKTIQHGCFGCLGLILIVITISHFIGSSDRQKDRKAQTLRQTDSRGTTAPASLPSQEKVATIDKSENMQKTRKELIAKLINQGIFQKIEIPGHLPRVWVKPGFYALDFDMKDRFVGVVYAYYFDDDNGIVTIFDSLSGKEVGDYSTVNFMSGGHGLKMK